MRVKLTYSIEIEGSGQSVSTADLIVPEGKLTEVLGQNPVLFTSNALALSALAIAKGISYKDSWKRHGEMFSIVPNLLRKMDRIQACVQTNTPAGKIDGSADLAVYALLFLQDLENRYPEDFKQWHQKDVLEYIETYAKGTVKYSEAYPSGAITANRTAG